LELSNIGSANNPVGAGLYLFIFARSSNILVVIEAVIWCFEDVLYYGMVLFYEV